MASTSYKQIACYITPQQHDLLKELSVETLVPMQAILRQGVNMILHRNGKLPKTMDDEYIEKRITGLKRGARK
jgi:hypothetical protein